MSGPTMAGSKTQPLAKCQLSRAPRIVLSMLITPFREPKTFESSVSRRCITSLSTTQVQSADHTQEIEKTEEVRRKLLVNLVKLAKTAIPPALGIRAS